MRNILTVDVEEYFNPAEVQGPHCTIADWPSFPSRIEIQVDRVLDLLARHSASATFFVLGWVAERHPQMVRRIASAGCEVGCHSYSHRLITQMSPDDFRTDTNRAIEAIGNACGQRPRSYRAPSYSIGKRTLWALDVLNDEGFFRDSSIYPIQHDRYGIPGFERHAQWIPTNGGVLFEVPVATVQLAPELVAPVGGGGYLRLLPYRYTSAGIRAVNELEHQPACIYFHPWEIDPDQPRLAHGFIARWRTYTGLGGMGWKIERLLNEFRFSAMSTVYPLFQAVSDPLSAA